jgi:hypothetical protein
MAPFEIERGRFRFIIKIFPRHYDFSSVRFERAGAGGLSDAIRDAIRDAIQDTIRHDMKNDNKIILPSCSRFVGYSQSVRWTQMGLSVHDVHRYIDTGLESYR